MNTNPQNMTMTEQELKHAIQEGLVENQIHRFVSDDLIKNVGRKKDCPTVRKAAWRNYVESVKDTPNPATH